MKIVQFLGIGLEGSGVSRFASELENWGTALGHTFTTIANADLKYQRKQLFDLKNVKDVKFDVDNLPKDVILDIEQCDLLIVQSIPQVKDTTERSLKRMSEFFSIAKEQIYIHHNHDLSNKTLFNLAFLDDLGSLFKTIYVHSLNGEMATYLRNPLNECAAVIKTFQPTINMQAVKDKYWKPIDQIIPKSMRWIGRSNAYKGYVHAFNIHSALKNNGFKLTFEGLDASPAFIAFKNTGEFLDRRRKAYSANETIESDLPLVYSEYKNCEMLERMSKTNFALVTSYIRKDPFRSLEFPHLEAAAAGALTVFNKSFGDKLVHRSGKKLASCVSGTIWYDKENPEEALEDIKDLAFHTQLAESYRHTAFAFYKEHQDASVVFPEMFPNL